MDDPTSKIPLVLPQFIVFGSGKAFMCGAFHCRTMHKVSNHRTFQNYPIVLVFSEFEHFPPEFCKNDTHEQSNCPYHPQTLWPNLDWLRKSEFYSVFWAFFLLGSNGDRRESQWNCETMEKKWQEQRKEWRHNNKMCDDDDSKKEGVGRNIWIPVGGGGGGKRSWVRRVLLRPPFTKTNILKAYENKCNPSKYSHMHDIFILS